MKDLERRVYKRVSEVQCPNRDCEVRAEYYKCYIEYEKCPLYARYLKDDKKK